MLSISHIRSYLILSAIAVIGFLAFGYQSTAAQSAVCHATWFDFNSGSELSSLSGVSASHNSLGITPDLDAAGYDVSSGLIYGLDEFENLYSVNPDTASVTNLGPVYSHDGARTLSDEFKNEGIFSRYQVGDVNDGKLYVMPGGNVASDYAPGMSLLFSEKDDLKDVIEINLASLTYARHEIDYPGVDESPDAHESYFVGDVVYIDGKLYSVNGNQNFGNGQLAVADIDTSKGYSVTLHGLPRDTEYGALWLARNHNDTDYEMYAVASNNGSIYRINGYDGSQPTAQLVGNTDNITITDGAGCPDISAPALNITANDDSYEATGGMSIPVDWASNDAAGSTITLGEVDKASAAGAEITVTSDGFITYVAPVGFNGLDSFTYSACAEVAFVSYCDPAIVTVQVASPVLDVSTSVSGDSDNSTISVAVTANNTGQGTATGTSVSVIVPAGTSFVQSTGWTCLSDGSTGDTCTAQLTDISAGGTGQIAYALTVVDDTARDVQLVTTVESDSVPSQRSEDTFTIESDGAVTVVLGTTTDGSGTDATAQTGAVTATTTTAEDGSYVASGGDTTVVLAETGQTEIMTAVAVGALILVGSVGLLRHRVYSSFSLR